MMNSKMPLTGRRQGLRDASNRGAMTRSMRISDAKIGDDGLLELIASTDSAVRMGGYREILSHEEGAVDFRSAVSLLINHDPNQIAGSIVSHELRNGRCLMMVRVHPKAMLQSGLTVVEAVNSGALRGVSMKYDYDFESDATFDRDSNTITANKWRFMEVTLTPISADIDAAIRSHPYDEQINQGLKTHISAREHIVKFTEWLMARGLIEAKLTDEQKKKARAIFDIEAELPEGFAPEAREAKKAPAAVPAPAVQPGDEAARAQELATANARAEKAETDSKLRSLAAEHNVDTKDFDFEGVRNLAEGTADLLRLKAKAEATAPHEGTMARIDYDEEDKARAMIDSYLMQRTHKSLTHEEKQGNKLHGVGIRTAAVRWGRSQGIKGIDDWSKNDQAFFALGDFRNMSREASRAAANIINSSFSGFVTLDAVHKIVAKGFESPGRSVNYQLWTEDNTVGDFKNFNIGALGTGNLIETAENVAFPELDKSEGVYTEAVKMWGGTLSLTLQALTNDDTGQFERSLRQSGAIAQKTINKRAYQKLLRGTTFSTDASTWTNNTTTGNIQYATADAAMAARQALDLVLAAAMDKTGQDGNPLGTVMSFLLCAPSIAGQARGITGGIAPGQTTLSAPIAGPLQVIESPWLSTGSTLTGALSGNYYLLGDPAEVTTMLYTTVEGMETPQVMEYDAGATAQQSWKIFHPFENSLVAMNNKAGVNIMAGAQQGTAA